VDPTRERNLTARFPARLETLYVNFEGISVKQGDHLAKVYSPDLFAAQSELLTAYRHDPGSAMTRAAREKLRLWDLLPEQVDAILQRGSARDRMDINAPIGGVVVEKHVKEGDYLQTGQSLFRIADLNVLWLQLEAYESDLLWLRYGQEVVFTVESFPGEAFEGIIAFIEPKVDPRTRTVQVRVNVPNPDKRLKPGMFARGIVKSVLAADGSAIDPDLAGKWISPMHPEVVKDGPGACDVCGMDLVPAESLGYSGTGDIMNPLMIPASAVLRTGKRSVVYVRRPDTERPTFEGREVVVGPKAGDYFVVNEGLTEGEEVVTRGAFKIDSALQIVAKPSMMNPPPTPVPVPSIELSESLAAQLLPGYLYLHAALAADDPEKAEAALRILMDTSGHEGALAELLHTMMERGTLDDMRRPHFEVLSKAMIETLRNNPEAHQGLRIMHCPMVYDDRGANWIQQDPELLNPYFGASMLRCGETREVLGETEEKGESHDH
jgi:Cu(I)/Ag(I) efflux system membrane fusion protein